MPPVYYSSACLVRLKWIVYRRKNDDACPQRKPRTVNEPPATSPAPRRRWGARKALFDDREATQRLLDAAATCVIRRGTARVSMSEVAEEAGVTRSTLYRYFPNGAELITALILSRAEANISRMVARLPHPENAALSLPTVVLDPVENNELGDALMSPDSEGLAAALEFDSEALVDAVARPLGPLLESWQASGQIHADLDIRTTVRWLIAQTVVLLSRPWMALSPEDRRRFVTQYIARALLAT